MTCKIQSKHVLLQLLLLESCCPCSELFIFNTDTQAVTSGEYAG